MSEKVLIIGAGSGGLACALFLEKAGIPCEIYEQAPEFSNVGASFALHQNGVHVLDQLGLAEEVKKDSHELTDYLIKDKAGETLFTINTLTEDPSLFEGFLYMTRHQLIDVLYEEVKKKGISLHFGKRLQAFNQDEDSVTVQFEDGTEATGSLLVGADGTRSKVRSLLFPDEQLEYNGKWAVFGMGEEDKLDKAMTFLEQDYLSTYIGEDFNLTISKHHPTNNERLSWVYIQNQERKLSKEDFEDKPTEQFKQEVAQQFNSFKEPISEMVLNSSTFIPVQIYDVGKMSKFSCGRVTLIGDALQTTDPYTGMGATLSLEDALYLAKMLREHKDYEEAFYNYEVDRKEKVHSIHDSVDIMQDIDENTKDKQQLEEFLEGYDLQKLIDSFLAPPKVYWK